MNKKTIKDIDVQGKKVLVRVDFNVPMSSKDPNDQRSKKYDEYGVKLLEDYRTDWHFRIESANYKVGNGCSCN